MGRNCETPGWEQGPLAGRREMGPTGSNFASLENEPEDEGLARDHRKI